MKRLEKDKETVEEMWRMSMETLSASKKRKSDPDKSAEEKRCKKRKGGSDTVQKSIVRWSLRLKEKNLRLRKMSSRL